MTDLNVLPMFYAEAASSDAAGIQPEEGGSQPTPLLQPPDFSLARWGIREVERVTAERWMARWHYLGDAPPASEYWGIFAPDLAAVVSIGLPNNVHGVAGRFGLGAFVGNVEINRVARHPLFDPPVSRFLTVVIRHRQAIRPVDWLFSYADPKQGHHGGIYQALGAVYVGVSPKSHGWEGSGGILHPRTAVSVFGSQAGASMAERGYRRIDGMFGGLHTYILPIGPRQAEIRDVLAPIAQPYPKRDIAA